MDASLLNLGLFTALLVLGSLAPLSRLPRRLRDVSWLMEGLVLVGTLVATALILGASAGAIFQSMGDPTYMALLEDVTNAEGDTQREAAGRSFMAYASAFFPVADSASVTLGLASGAFVERLGTVAYVFVFLLFLIAVGPVAAVATVAYLVGYGSDGRAAARNVWLFNLAVLGVVALNAVALGVAALCTDADGALGAACGLLGAP